MRCCVFRFHGRGPRAAFYGMALAGGFAALSGCSDVDPWERGRLAKPHMALDPHPTLSELRNHTNASREAASGGSEAEGGGCGCN